MPEARPVPPGPPLVRPYRAADRAACLALLQANVPQHFGADERGPFGEWLDSRPTRYLVAEAGGRVVACGGIEAMPEGAPPELRWVMVAPGLQQRGLGRLLMLRSLHALLRHAEVPTLAAMASQTSAAFFVRFGEGLGGRAEVVRVAPDYWSAGLDLHRVEIALPSDARARVGALLAAR